MHRTARCAVGVLALAACRTTDAPSHIPERDGTLVVQLRYPTDGVVLAGDSIAMWGDVGTGRATLAVNDVPIPVARNGGFAGLVTIPRAAPPRLRFVARKGQDSVVHVVSLARMVAAAGAPAPAPRARAVTAWLRMQRAPSDTADSATQWRPIYSRWLPGGAVALPLAQGMRLPADARTDSAWRLHISDFERVWVPIADAVPAESPGAPRFALAGFDVACDREECRIDLAIPEPVPASIELSGDRLIWTVYRAAFVRPPAARDADGVTVRRVVASDTVTDRVVLGVSLTALPIGWKSEFRDGVMRLRVRQAHDPSRALRALRIVVDPGHPPDGSTGPTGLREDSLTLAVGLRVAALLRERGAVVSLTRSDDRPVSLEARGARIEQESPHIFVSIHANSPGAGRPPEAVNATFVYWMHPHSRFLAGVVANDVARSLGQGTRAESFGEYAVLRSAWATGILVEGLGIVLPEREAFLRTRAGVEAYARGVVAGLERWSTSPRARLTPRTAAPF